MKLTQKATSGEQKLNILSYNPGLKTEFHISCSHLPKTILDFAKLCILPDLLPQPYNFLHGYIRHICDILQLWLPPPAFNLEIHFFWPPLPAGYLPEHFFD